MADIQYLLSGNVAEIIVLLIGLAFKDENGQSVFPLSPVAALWINTLAAGPPALALGLEPTADDAMEQPPTAFHQIFNLEFYIDLAFYGFLIGALSLVNFVIVLWGYFPVCLVSSRFYSLVCDAHRPVRAMLTFSGRSWYSL
jgi:Na+-exporting ATPase